MWEGSFMENKGEVLLIFLDDTIYLKIVGGYRGPYFKLFKTNEIIYSAIYVVTSGGQCMLQVKILFMH
jgi:hypothetical protein